MELSEEQAGFRAGTKCNDWLNSLACIDPRKTQF